MALSEFQYPRSWYNLRNLDNHIYVDSGGQGYPSVSIIPHGYYPTVKEFVSAVNKTLKTDANGDIWLTYNHLTRKMTTHVRNKATLGLTGRFASMVGFDKKRGDDNKEYGSSVTRRFGSWISRHVFVHNIVETQLVSDSKVSLLKVVKCSGEFGDNVSVNFPNLQYVPVNVKSFEMVEIDIKDDTQEKVPFEFGKVIVTLHFRQRRSPLFI